ncbi:MAG TPA: UDP-N-acetylmuramoyl-tripeptide--D-alanyl-D-alanine ligase [Dictyoglomaceae bacterium]|nr:UDP-N-acetylmuramoyl-tripeptide--D-alanyl-D-alanine ligase [Dictyoglomaceae bacterium]HOL38865.1 UDP-N-acetylmuramoyl-tripeptide--D-alanyl-D-alanine ligase [Dictyoglomaceae bacterium]HPP15718.1 UDP-N-acetylmuramoyl-tripeptide--D-alanyl-D-alanine ligase [Dictyoglomaceae bacterium]
MNLTVKEVLLATKGNLIKGNIDETINSISIDSRTIHKNDFFIPIRGERFDGHKFIDEAVENGAVGVILSKVDHTPKKEIVIIKVEDTLSALQSIASYYRKKLQSLVIGITGSSGKTITKNFTFNILKNIGKTYMSKESYNNEIGVPLTIVGADEDTDFLILEMAMRNKGDLSLLSKIAEPEIGLITNIGWAHIGRLGSREAIMEAKSEIFEYMKEDGYALLNGDDEYSLRIYDLLPKKFNKLSFGFGENNHIQGVFLEKTNKEVTLLIKFPNQKEITLRIPLLPKNIYRNLLGALGIAWVIEPEYIESIDKTFNLYFPKQRLNVKETKNGIIVIDDTYNANPDSVKTAIEFLEIYPSYGRKFILLGDMLELGDYSLQAHEEVIKEALEKKFDLIFLFGEEIGKAYENIGESQKEEKVIYAKERKEIEEILKKVLQPKDVILIKGSRGMKMEAFVEFLEAIL